MQLALGPALMVTRGFAAPEVGAAYTRARLLCQQVEKRRSSSGCCGDSSGFMKCRPSSRRPTASSQSNSST